MTMGDIKNPKLLYAKGALFLLLGILSAGLILWENWSVKTLVLLLVAIWAFCRAYYFVFYVIQHYVDDEYRFAGLWDFFKYLCGRRSSKGGESDLDDTSV
jgi:hypothetical protein